MSNEGLDIAQQFIPWREFGFQQLREGNLSLWNPHIYSGAPFFGGFQSALLYPPNVLFLILPIDKAINWSIALHVFLLGAFMFLWARHRGLQLLSCFLSAIIVMFGGAHFLHIYAGHLPNLCSMVWVPLIFLAIDKIFEKPALGSVLLGAFATTMQILAGHPQYVFYTAVAAGIYSCLNLARAESRGKILLGLGAICVGAIGLSAIQLFTGLVEAKETVRSLGTSYNFAAMFSFPPENFLTLVAPNFFGDIKTLPYWSRGYLWEMSLFVSLTGFALAGYGAISGDRTQRRFSLAMILILLLLACSARTPLFHFLYHWVPGFNKFRGNSKFIFQATLFVALLAGIGLDAVIKGQKNLRAFAAIGFGVAILFVGGALWIKHSSSAVPVANGWGQIFEAINESRESPLPEEKFSDATFISQAGAGAAKSFFIVGATLALFSTLLLVVRRVPKASLAILVLALLELFIFARSSLDSFELSKTRSPEVAETLAKDPGDYRVLNFDNSNIGMSLGANDLWGYDPGVLLRYAQFISFTQESNPDDADGYVTFSQMHPLYAMLRCRFVFSYPSDGKTDVMLNENTLPRLQLIKNYRVLPERNSIFNAMDGASFDPRNEVILEESPVPAPRPSEENDTVELVNSSTDHLTVKANLSSPSILLITDTYSKGWRARALPGSAQVNYEIMPANYCLRAIPLAAGNHHLRIEYLPTAFIIGKWVSIASAILFAGLIGWCFRKKFV